MASETIKILTEDVNKIKDLKSAELFNLKYDSLSDFIPKKEITKENIKPIINILKEKNREIGLKIDKIVKTNIPKKGKDYLTAYSKLEEEGILTSYLELSNTLQDFAKDLQDIVGLRSYRKKEELASELDKNVITAFYLKKVYSYGKGIIKHNTIQLKNPIKYEDFLIKGVIDIRGQTSKNSETIAIFDGKIYDVEDEEIIGENNEYELKGLKITRKILTESEKEEKWANEAFNNLKIEIEKIRDAEKKGEIIKSNNSNGNAYAIIDIGDLGANNREEISFKKIVNEEILEGLDEKIKIKFIKGYFKTSKEYKDETIKKINDNKDYLIENGLYDELINYYK